DQRTKDLHARAFTRNAADPDYHTLSSLSYSDGTVTREMKVPKGDVLWQFRQDVETGRLPMVSWLVGPENFSDHPGAPWYGAWYVSEVMDILTKNPEVWKKTIFVLCYDENDGYFDHVPPFVAPDPGRPETGRVSAGIDAALEYHTREQDLLKAREKEARGGPIGLGYRVPLVIASPWSRGGFVNSQVCDHTSILMMLENFVNHKTAKGVREANISEWRRTVCGDLSSVFRPYRGEKVELPSFLEKDAVLKGINQARYRDLPAGFRKLSEPDIAAARREGFKWAGLPEQERGTRPSCALPYELAAEGLLSADAKSCELKLESFEAFGKKSAGAPFIVYVHGREITVRNYAVKAGDSLADHILLEDGRYDLRVHGPNGWYREIRGSKNDPALSVMMITVEGKCSVAVGNRSTNKTFSIQVIDN
ncbi:MAG TPA: alkaline phosphatase family protein, partial [Puia sp.]|nr:alkaline phosphatase family protein [Puia sp.]